MFTAALFIIPLQLETTQMSITRRMDIQTVVYLYYGILLINGIDLSMHITQMNHTDIMLNEENQIQKSTNGLMPFR